MANERLGSWMRAAVLGALVGLPVLGLGGRAAMRVIAVAGGTDGTATLEGTMTVLLAGAGSGAAAGVIYRALVAVLPRRRHLRDLAFLLVLAGLALRGLRPIQALPLALFGLLVALFAVVFLVAWPRVVIRLAAVDKSATVAP